VDTSEEEGGELGSAPAIRDAGKMPAVQNGETEGRLEAGATGGTRNETRNSKIEKRARGGQQKPEIPVLGFSLERVILRRFLS